MLFTVIALMGCTEEEDTTAESAANMEGDVAATARVLEEIALQPTTVEDCFEDVGCTFCYSATGTPLSGTFTAGLEDTCEASYDSRAGTATYTVTESLYDGSWSATTSTITVTAAGSRTTSITGPRERERNQPAVLTVDEATLVADTSGVVESFTFSGSYVGSGGVTYSLDLTETDGALDGTVSAGDASCTVGGTRTAPTFDCER